MSQYVPKPHEPFGGDISVRVDLSNYETKADMEDFTYWCFKFCTKIKFIKSSLVN